MNEKSKRQTDGHLGRQVNVRLKDDDAERLDRLTKKHGGIAPTIKAALKALEGSNELTDAELISTLKQRLESKQEKKQRDIDRDIDRDRPKTDQPKILSSPNRIVTPPPKRNQ